MMVVIFHEKNRNSKRWNQGCHKEEALDSWNSQALSVKIYRKYTEPLCITV